jgi:hypothetical protein
MTKLLIWLDNGQNIQTQSNVAADLAGLVNAPGGQVIYSCTDLYSGQTMHIVLAHIVCFQDVSIP